MNNINTSITSHKKAINQKPGTPKKVILTPTAKVTQKPIAKKYPTPLTIEQQAANLCQEITEANKEKNPFAAMASRIKSTINYLKP